MSLSHLVSPAVPTPGFHSPGLRVGTPEYSEGPTGITFLYVPQLTHTVVCAGDGFPRTAFSEVSGTGYRNFVNAIPFCGGSADRLEGGSAVVAGLLSAGDVFQGWRDIAVTNAAVVFDYKGRDNRVYLDGIWAWTGLQNAREGSVTRGTPGTGRFVYCGS